MGKTASIIAANTKQAKRYDSISYKDRERRAMAGTPQSHWAISAIDQSATAEHLHYMPWDTHYMPWEEVERRISETMDVMIPIMRMHPWFIWAKSDKILRRNPKLDVSDLNYLLSHYALEYGVAVEYIEE